MITVEGTTRGNIFLKQLTCPTNEFELSIVIQRNYTLSSPPPRTLSHSVSDCRMFVLVVLNMLMGYK
jgi:hypothetical protein